MMNARHLPLLVLIVMGGALAAQPRFQDQAEHQFYLGDTFHVAEQYHWLEVASNEDVECLPKGTRAVRITGYVDYEGWKLLAAVEGLEALDLYRADEGMQTMPLNALPSLRVLFTSFDDETAKSVGALQNLEVLMSQWSNCLVSDEAFLELGKLQKLHTLALGGNFAVDERRLSTPKVGVIASLNKLRRLDLSYNFFEEGAVVELKRLQQLEELVLYSAHKLEHLGDAVAGMTRLRWLALGLAKREAQVVSEVLKSAKSLERLDLVGSTGDYEGVESMVPVSLPTGLKQLHLWRPRLAVADWKRVVERTSLEQLTLYAVHEEGGPDEFPFSSISALTNLKYLATSSIRTTPKLCRALANLPKLETLYVDGYSLTVESLNALCASKTLRSVAVNREHAVDEAWTIAAFSRLPALESLTVWSAGLAAEGITAFAGHKLLRELVLTGVPELLDEEIEVLGKLPALRRACIAFSDKIGPEDTEATVAALIANPQLSDLRLAGLPLNQPCVETLGKGQRLRHLYAELDGSKGAFNALAMAAGLERVKVVAVGGNIDSEGFASVSNLTKLTEFQLVGVREDAKLSLRKAWKGNPHTLKFLDEPEEPWLEGN